MDKITLKIVGVVVMIALFISIFLSVVVIREGVFNLKGDCCKKVYYVSWKEGVENTTHIENLGYNGTLFHTSIEKNNTYNLWWENPNKTNISMNFIYNKREKEAEFILMDKYCFKKEQNVTSCSETIEFEEKTKDL